MGHACKRFARVRRIASHGAPPPIRWTRRDSSRDFGTGAAEPRDYNGHQCLLPTPPSCSTSSASSPARCCTRCCSRWCCGRRSATRRGAGPRSPAAVDGAARPHLESGRALRVSVAASRRHAVQRRPGRALVPGPRTAGRRGGPFSGAHRATRSSHQHRRVRQRDRRKRPASSDGADRRSRVVIGGVHVAHGGVRRLRRRPRGSDPAADERATPALDAGTGGLRGVGDAPRAVPRRRQHLDRRARRPPGGDPAGVCDALSGLSLRARRSLPEASVDPVGPRRRRVRNLLRRSSRFSASRRSP